MQTEGDQGGAQRTVRIVHTVPFWRLTLGILGALWLFGTGYFGGYLFWGTWNSFIFTLLHPLSPIFLSLGAEKCSLRGRTRRCVRAVRKVGCFPSPVARVLNPAPPIAFLN